MKYARERFLKLGIGLAISLACIAFILSRIDIDALWRALAQLRWPMVAVALLSLTIDYALRVLRWSVMLRAAGATTSALDCAPAFLGSMALNNVLPLRAGDVVRALVFPASLGVRRTTATASLVLERLVDLLTLLACLGAGLVLSPLVQLPDWQSHLVAWLSIGGAAALFALILVSTHIAHVVRKLSTLLQTHGKSKLGMLCTHLAHLFDGLATMSRPRTLGILGALSVLVWLGEAGLFLALLHGFGIAATPAVAITIMATATLATLIPSSPGYVGPFHLAAFTAVTAIGGDEAQAAAFALVAHLALWIPVTLAGMVCILARPRLFQRDVSTKDLP